MKKLKTNFSYKITKRGNLAKTLYEHYIRDDIPCFSPICSQCSKTISKHKIHNFSLDPNSSIYYIISSHTLLLNFLDIFESPSCKNIIILETIYNAFKNHASYRQFLKLKNILHDPRKYFIKFDNEHCKDTYTSENDIISNSTRSILNTASYYIKHLNLPSIYIINKNNEDNQTQTDQISKKIINMDIENYIKEKLPDNLFLYESLKNDINRDKNSTIMYTYIIV